jgi:phospholipid-binding lipoprotein MlaA
VRLAGVGRGLWAVLRGGVVAALFVACGSVGGGLRAADPEGAAEPPALGREVVLAQATAEPPADEEEIYDPWEPFNERIFTFNYNVDRYVLKPVARGYRAVVPERVQIMIANGFDNLGVVPRLVNSLLQGKVEGALREVSRFLVNSTLGIGGLFDVGKHAGLEPSKEDFGQTLGVWGAGPGPYLVLPLMPPMTVRDGIGRAVDGALDPLAYLLPFVWERLAMKVGETVNDRALNYDLFQGVEETTLDLYSSVRHFYLKRREQQIKE